MTKTIVLLGGLALLVNVWVAPAQLIVLEDFEDISDWTVSRGQGAAPIENQSFTLDSEEAQVGDFAGVFYAEHTDANGFDYVRISKTLDQPFDFSHEETIFSFYFKGPVQEGARPYLTLRLTSSNNGFMEHNIHKNYSSGDWVLVQLDHSVFGDFGSNPDLTSIDRIRFESVGDSSTWEGGGITYYFDQMEVT